VVAEALAERYDLLFVGARLAESRFFNREKFDFLEIGASTISLSPKKMFKALPLILQGMGKSRAILKDFKPDLVVGFGSFFTFPLLLSSLMMRVPYMLHEQNSLPGRVNRLFSPYAKMTAISFPGTEKWLKGKNIVEVDFPLREGREEIDSWNYFGLERDRPILLVFGGSQGAKMLNHLVMEMAPTLSPHIQILHFTGDKEAADQASSLYKKLGLRYLVKEFEEKMHHAMLIADVAITRAGASTIAELIEEERPAILIPFPHAKDNHQIENAKHFVDSVQGGKLLLQESVTPSLLKETLLQLLSEKEARRANIQRYKESKKLKKFSEYIIEFLG
jgi:UDP-N-acetylglucosamine--N-acetylmuramyl-(pentapeptide) pyrophosphoryl-undecaprenol N-acetylglucosamine transferase